MRFGLFPQIINISINSAPNAVRGSPHVNDSSTYVFRDGSFLFIRLFDISHQINITLSRTQFNRDIAVVGYNEVHRLDVFVVKLPTFGFRHRYSRDFVNLVEHYINV